jgi:TolB protein
MQIGLPNSRLYLALLLAGVLLRLAVFFVVAAPGQPPFSDMRYYAEVGEKLFQGEALDSYEQYYMPLGLSYLYAFVRLLGADPTVTLPLFNICLDLLSCLLIGRLATVLVSRSVAPWAFGAACLYPPFVLQSGFMLTETPFLFLGLSAYYWYVSAVTSRQHTFTPGFLAGLSFALAILFKTNLWLLIPIILVASLVKRALRCSRTFVVGAICGLVLCNGLVKPSTPSFSLASVNQSIANASVNLYLGRTYARYLVSSYKEKSQWVHNTPPALFFKNKNAPIIVNHSPLDGWFFIEATGRYVWEHKMTLLSYSAEHVLDALGLVPYWPLVETRLAFIDAPLRLGIVFVVMLPALVSFCLLLKSRARLLVALPLVAILLVSMVFFGSPRYRMPYDGYLLILAATFYGHVLTRRPQLTHIRLAHRLHDVQLSVKTMIVLILAFLGFICVSKAQAGIVYSALPKGEKWSVYYQTSLTSPPKRILGAADGDQSAPSLLPDKRRVAFEVQGAGIHVCPLDASTPCQVMRSAHGSAVRPAWHPVTGALLFVRYLAGGTHEDAEIFTTRDGFASTSLLLRQTGIQDYPDVSPDGRLLAYTSAQTISLHRSGVQVVQHLWIMNLETGRARQLLLSSAQDIQPDWSPSGQELAFASNRTGQFEIWVVNADSGSHRQVTAGPGAKTWPAWSPDGRSIMFTKAQEGRQSLWLIDADGTHLRPFEPFGAGQDIH